VDQRLDAPAENKVDPKDLQSVTLLVTPEQAALLDLGQNLGQLTLSLRNLDDKSETSAEPATLAMLRSRSASKSLPSIGSLLGLFKRAEAMTDHDGGPARPQHRPTVTIRTLRGVQSGEVVVGG
jgi:Flp pilus assembly protein CpaB